MHHGCYLANEKVDLCIRMWMFFHNYTLLRVLCRKKSTMKGLFSLSHFKVTRKQSTLPHSRYTQDISMEQLSSEPILYGSYD